jgi:hypothetical protein
LPPPTTPGLSILILAALSAFFAASATASDEQLREYVISQIPLTVIVPDRPGIAPSLPLTAGVGGSSLIYDIYVNQPSLAGFHNNPTATACISAIAAVFTLEGVLVVRLNLGTAAELAATESVVLPSTRQLQHSLQRLFVIQSLLFVACFIIPTFVVFLCIMEVIPQTRLPLFSLACYVMVNVHTPLLLMRLISLRPYRQAIRNWLGREKTSRREGVSSADVNGRRVAPLRTLTKSFTIVLISDGNQRGEEGGGGSPSPNDFSAPSIA